MNINIDSLRKKANDIVKKHKFNQTITTQITKMNKNKD